LIRQHKKIQDPPATGDFLFDAQRDIGTVLPGEMAIAVLDIGNFRYRFPKASIDIAAILGYRCAVIFIIVFTDV
jgi:hypothetical protein